MTGFFSSAGGAAAFLGAASEEADLDLLLLLEDCDLLFEWLLLLRELPERSEPERSDSEASSFLAGAAAAAALAGSASSFLGSAAGAAAAAFAAGAGAGAGAAAGLASTTGAERSFTAGAAAAFLPADTEEPEREATEPERL